MAPAPFVTLPAYSFPWRKFMWNNYRVSPRFRENNQLSIDLHESQVLSPIRHPIHLSSISKVSRLARGNIFEWMNHQQLNARGKALIAITKFNCQLEPKPELHCPHKPRMRKVRKQLQSRKKRSTWRQITRESRTFFPNKTMGGKFAMKIVFEIKRNENFKIFILTLTRTADRTTLRRWSNKIPQRCWDLSKQRWG